MKNLFLLSYLISETLEQVDANSSNPPTKKEVKKDPNTSVNAMRKRQGISDNPDLEEELQTIESLKNAETTEALRVALRDLRDLKNEVSILASREVRATKRRNAKILVGANKNDSFVQMKSEINKLSAQHRAGLGLSPRNGKPFSPNAKVTNAPGRDNEKYPARQNQIGYRVGHENVKVRQNGLLAVGCCPS